MEFILLSPESWVSARQRLIGYAVRFGDKRLTSAALHQLRKLDGSALAATSPQRYEAAAVIARHDGRIIGFGFAASGEAECCIVVVHPEARRQGVGRGMMNAMMSRIGAFSCNVAADNTASMAMCFSLGMKAVSMHLGPTGKPTLRFERGTAYDTARSRHSYLVP